MRKLVGVLFAGLFLAALARPGLADDKSGTGPNFTFGASTSYVYDFNDPDSNFDGVPGADFPPNALSYANFEGRDESFNIDLVQLGINGARGKASYGAKIDYGDLTALVGDDSGGDIGLQTAYLSYDFGGAGITAGRFDTPIGYEVLEPWGNANISRSYSWTLLQPINHDGIFVSGNAGIFDGMLGIANGFTVNEASTGFNDIDDEKAIIGAVGVAVSDAFNLYGSGIYTETADIVDTQMYNAIISGKIPMQGSGMRYALEGNVRIDDNDEGGATGTTPEGDGTQWSVVGYLGADFGPTSLDVRGEYLDQNMDFAAAIPFPGADGAVWDVTLTAGWYVTDGLQFRVEYRHDDADSDSGLFYVDGNNIEDNDDTLQAQIVWYPEL
jgi:hypothetical protein